MLDEKQLLDELDMIEPSKSIFISNYKLLKRERNKCQRYLKDIKDKLSNLKDENERDYYEKNNYYLLLCLKRIDKSIEIAEKILDEGVNEDKMITFYLSIYHIYEVIDFI